MHTPQHAPYKAAPIQYGAKVQRVEIDTTQPLTPKEIQCFQDIVGTLIYFARAVNSIFLAALSAIATQQANSLCCVASNTVTHYCNCPPFLPVKGTQPIAPTLRPYWRRGGVGLADWVSGHSVVTVPNNWIPMYFHIEISWWWWYQMHNHELIVISLLELHCITCCVRNEGLESAQSWWKQKSQGAFILNFQAIMRFFASNTVSVWQGGSPSFGIWTNSMRSRNGRCADQTFSPLWWRQEGSVIMLWGGTSHQLICQQWHTLRLHGMIDRNCDMLPLSLDDLLNYTTLMWKFCTNRQIWASLLRQVCF